MKTNLAATPVHPKQRSARRSRKFTFRLNQAGRDALQKMTEYIKEGRRMSSGMADRLVSAAIAHLFEQSIGQNIHLSSHLLPMPGVFINPVADDPISPTPSARPTLRLV